MSDKDIIIATNNKLFINEGSKPFDYLKTALLREEDDEFVPAYRIKNGIMEIGRGLMPFLSNLFSYSFDDRLKTELDYPVSLDFEDYRNLIEGFTLRDDQISCIIKSLKHKRGILQMATGSGKSLCIAGILLYLKKVLGYFPCTLLIEPTNYLVKEIMERLKSYGADITKYSSDRGNLSENRIYISHPSSIVNDLGKNKDLLNSVKILIADEAHHSSCRTWSFIHDNCSSIEISLGFSAYIMPAAKCGRFEAMKDMNFSELKAVCNTGAVLLNIDPSYYISQGILATPFLIRLFNRADEFVFNEKNWHLIRQRRLESKARIELCAKAASLFCDKGLKILLLSNTKKFSVKILRRLGEMGYRDKAVCSFGNNEYVAFDYRKKNPVERKGGDYKERFSEGDISIMICTSHMFEGADVPKLDAVMLCEVGKQVRRVIQGVGRGLRKTKTGKYAYIIDFTDHEGGVLSYHSSLRMEYYREIIGVRKIMDYATLDQVNDILDSIEKK